MLRNFKKVISNYKPFEYTVVINKNDAIHDVKPRVLSGVDLYSKYHGRPSKFASEYAEEIIDLNNMLSKLFNRF